MRFAARGNEYLLESCVVTNLSEDAVRVWGYAAVIWVCQGRADARSPVNVDSSSMFGDSRQLYYPR